MLLLLFLSQTATAQFYQQKSDMSRVLKYGVAVERKSDTLRVVRKNKSVRKKRNAAIKKKKNSVTKLKVNEPKNKVKYDGVKYKLGDRIIMPGDSGADVKSLANMLVELLFLDERDIMYTQNGVLYDGAIIKAVRSFQKVSGLYEDGMVSSSTLKALRKHK